MKIQALAVAAATLAFAAPALPAHASSEAQLRRDIRQAAIRQCNALRNGASWANGIRAAANGRYGRYWYTNANDDNRTTLVRLRAEQVEQMCPQLEARAYRRHMIAKGEWPASTPLNRPPYPGYAGMTWTYDEGPSYTGGTTTIQEDPFEF